MTRRTSRASTRMGRVSEAARARSRAARSMVAGSVQHARRLLGLGAAVHGPGLMVDELPRAVLADEEVGGDQLRALDGLAADDVGAVAEHAGARAGAAHRRAG